MIWCLPLMIAAALTLPALRTARLGLFTVIGVAFVAISLLVSQVYIILLVPTTLAVGMVWLIGHAPTPKMHADGAVECAAIDVP